LRSNHVGGQSMSKKNTRPHRGPGNDGSWYLDLLGVDGRASGGRRATPAERASGAREPAGPDPLEDWVPEQLSRTASSRRPFRWSVLVIIGVVIASVAVLAWWVPRVAEGRVTDRLTQARADLASARDTLAPTQGALAVATEPTATVSELTAAGPPLAAAAGAAERLSLQGVTPLPDAPPIIGSSTLEALRSEQVRFSFMGAEATASAVRITALIEYRLGLDRILALPDLPTVAAAGGLNALTASLAATLAESVSAAASLPEDAALAEHAATVDSAIDRFGEWQVEYIEVLRRGLEAEAEILVAEISEVVARLDDALMPVLSSLRVEIDTAILELATQIDTTLLRLPH